MALIDPRIITEIINPKLEVIIYGTVPGVDDLLFTEVTDVLTGRTDALHVDFDIHKDLREQPNSATVRIYNLDPSSRAMLTNAKEQQAPIVINATPGGIFTMANVFTGNISDVYSRYTGPGHTTTITCYDHKHYYRDKTVDRAFTAGTPIDTVIRTIAQFDIGLTPIFWMPVLDLLGVGRTFSGPAFRLLSALCRDYGMKCYIQDGALFITSIYMPIDVTPKLLFDYEMLEMPQTTQRTDADAVERQSRVEVITRTGTRRRKKTRMQKADRKVTFVDYVTVDQTVRGIEFDCFLRPDIVPDSIVKYMSVIDPAWVSKQWRVTDCHYYGSNASFDNWTTSVQADEFIAI